MSEPGPSHPSRTRVAAASLISSALVLYAVVYPTRFTWHARKEPLDYGLVIGAVGAVYLGVGIYAWAQRPANRTGLLMAAVGLGWLSYQLSWLPGPAYYLAYATDNLELPFLAWLALAYPIGRLRHRYERVLLLVTWLIWAYPHLLNLLTDNQGPCSPEVCRNQFYILDINPGLANVVFAPGNYGGMVIAVAILAVIVRHWRQATVRARRSIVPLLWMAGPPVAWVFASGLGHVGLWRNPDWLWPWFNLALVSVPVGYVYARVRDRLARGGVGDLIVGLGTGGQVADLRRALARTLRDPSLEVGYWLPEEQRYADLAGASVELPPPGDPHRATTVLERDGEPLAAIVHDAAVADDPELMAAAAAAVRMAIEREQLQVLVRAQLDEVRASRARIVAAQDEERRRLERNLHDGAQQRLVTLSLVLGEARGQLPETADGNLRVALDGAATEVAAALGELRELAQGIHPAVLTRSGLVSAVRSLAERARLPVTIEASDIGRLPDAIEAAGYFVVSESLTNAAKHSRATLVRVRVTVIDGQLRIEVADDGVGGARDSAGSGLRGLADRVRALGGRFQVLSSPGAGTQIIAELPCG